MSIFSTIRCVAFDLDDTLWPCEPTITKAEQALYKWLTEHFPRITDCYSIEEIRQKRAQFGIQHQELAHNVTELRRQFLKELACEFNYPDEMAHSGLKLFRKIRNQVNFFKDALPTIDKLKQYFQIGAITNGNADLVNIGVDHKFDYIVTAEIAGAAKPDKKIFQYAQRKFNLESHQILLVGDAPVVDVVAARECGWQAIWFNPKKERWSEHVKPNAEVQSLSQLIELLIKN